MLGREFVIRSDQKSLKGLLQQIIQMPDQQLFVRKLMGYKFRIEYKMGASNKAADALSRRDMEVEDAAVATSMLALVSHPIPGSSISAVASLLPRLQRLRKLSFMNTIVLRWSVILGWIAHFADWPIRSFGRICGLTSNGLSRLALSVKQLSIRPKSLQGFCSLCLCHLKSGKTYQWTSSRVCLSIGVIQQSWLRWIVFQNMHTLLPSRRDLMPGEWQISLLTLWSNTTGSRRRWCPTAILFS